MINLKKYRKKFYQRCKSALESLNKCKNDLINRANTMIKIIISITNAQILKISKNYSQIQNIIAENKDFSDKIHKIINEHGNIKISESKLDEFNEIAKDMLSIVINDYDNLPSALNIHTCLICSGSFNKNNILSLSMCDHCFCKECFNANIEYLVSDISLIDNLSKCPYCFVEIPPYQLSFLLHEEVIEKINKYAIQKMGELVKCPKCRFEFIPCFLRKIICLNKDCGHIFCKNCEQDYHEDESCQEGYILARIKDLEALNDPGGVSQCPRCRIPYIMIPKCDHVKCVDSLCAVEFCFRCSCLRSPTLEHGNHYHRPSCTWYGAYHGNDDKYEKRCIECIRLGKKCDRPKDLRVKRRLDPDEIGK